MQKANKTSTFPRIVITLTALQNTVKPNLKWEKKSEFIFSTLKM